MRTGRPMMNPHDEYELVYVMLQKRLEQLLRHQNRLHQSWPWILQTLKLSPTHPIRLGLTLNFLVFYPDCACGIAKQLDGSDAARGTVNQTWSQPAIKGTPPTPRDSHTCSVVGDRLFVFGGTDGMNPLKDLHILDI
ncbi:RING finger protein B-like, partial [Trifolium medium]|nr:RING finger protein B-like [Trifolium medium]